jgi:hypothetical protein
MWPASGELDGTSEPYVGAAHGSAGIALALAAWGRHAGCKRAVDLAVDTFHSIYVHGRIDDGTNLRVRLGAKCEQASLGTWCHGAAGYLWCMLNAFGDDPRLREEIDWATNAFARSVPVANPTYCHGSAGHLELWRMVGAIPRFERLGRLGAARTAGVLRSLQLRWKGNCVWSSEEPDVVTPDLWVGFLGPASALALYASECSQPLLSARWLAKCSKGSLP